MDPLSIAAGITGVSDVALRTISALVSYIKDTKHATLERELLAREAIASKTSLELLLNKIQTKGLDPEWLESRTDLLQQFLAAYKGVAKTLNIEEDPNTVVKQRRLRTFLTSAKWSFSKSDVFFLLDRLSRIQQCAKDLALDHQNTVILQIDGRQQDHLNEKTKRRICNWLSPLNMNQVQQEVSSRTVAGSGKWFLASDIYSSWHYGDRRLLWCYGIPGAGKTAMASLVISHLRDHRVSDGNVGKIGIAVLFLKYNDPKHIFENLLGSIASQVIQEMDTVPNFIKDLYEQHSNGEMPMNVSETAEALRQVVQDLQSTYVLVDGLDETTEQARWDLIEQILELPESVRVMITSRAVDSIDKDFKDFAKIELRAHREDIELFIDDQIRRNRKLRQKIQKNPSYRQEIKDGVVRTADGMFLLARLHIESLANAAMLSMRHVRKRLESLPTTLQQTYEEALERITNQEAEHKEIAMKCLAWVSYALRSLTLKELQHAIAIEPGDTRLDEEMIVDGQSLATLCAGLLVIDQGTNLVNLVHYSAKSYFESIKHTLFPGFHGNITLSCATYLNLEGLEDANIWRMIQSYPLAFYAAQFMAEHARYHGEDALEPSIIDVICRVFAIPAKRRPLLSLLDGLELMKAGRSTLNPSLQLEDLSPKDERVLSIFESSNDDTVDVEELAIKSTRTTTATATTTNSSDSVFTADITDTVSTITAGMSSDIPKPSRTLEVTALHLAASMGLARVASVLIEGSGDIDAVDENGHTALSVALERGFEKAVEFLVENGAQVDLQTSHGRFVFLLSAERNWSKVAEVIMRKAQVVADQAEETQSAVIQTQIAAYRGNVSAISKLIDQEKVDIVWSDADIGRVALFLAVERSNGDLVQSLLKAGVAVDSLDAVGQTSLFRATKRGDEPMMRLLIAAGAGIEVRDNQGKTPLAANVHFRNERALRVLLHAGADVNTSIVDGSSNLYAAACNGDTNFVRFLLDLGTNPSITTKYGWVPLHWPSYHGDIEVVRLLIRHGADLSSVCDQGKTPLDLALENDQAEVVDFLRQCGALEAKHLPTTEPDQDETTADDKLGLISGTIDHNDRSRDKEKSGDSLVFCWDRPVGFNVDIGQWIYNSFKGSNSHPTIYRVSHPVDTPTKSMLVQLADTRPDQIEYHTGLPGFDHSRTIYEIVPKVTDHLEFNIRSPNNSSKGVNMTKTWTGAWRVYGETDGATQHLFKATADLSNFEEHFLRWTNSDGALVAITDPDPKLIFPEKLDDETQDLLITCWILTVWSKYVDLERL